MKCMVCNKETTPSVPLCFCEACRINRRPEMDTIIKRWHKQFKEIQKQAANYNQTGEKK